MNSWFNFYRRIKHIPPTIKDRTEGKFDGHFEYYFDKEKYKKDIKILNYLEQNKGKFIPVIDDITGFALTEEELKEMEEVRNSLYIPIYIETDPTELDPISLVPKIKRRTRAGRKLRIPVPTKIRNEIISQKESTCEQCGTFDANQIHHINNDPADNRRANLILLCYNCHLKHHTSIKTNEI